MRINENAMVDVIQKQVSGGMAPMARQVGCLFSEIFHNLFGIKSLNNLSFNKFKCKMAQAAGYRGKEQCSNSNNSKCSFFSHSMPRPPLQKGDQNHAYLM